MGFEALDVASMLVQQTVLPLIESNQPPAQVERAQIAIFFIAPAPSPDLPASAGVTIAILAGEQKVLVTGHISPALEALLLAQVRGAKTQEQVQAKVAQHHALVAAQTAADASQIALDYRSGTVSANAHLLDDPYAIEKSGRLANCGRAKAVGAASSGRSSKKRAASGVKASSTRC